MRLAPVVAICLSAAAGAGYGESYSQDKIPPAGFRDVVGLTLLCINQVDDYYLKSWMDSQIGDAEKHDGGAWWYNASGFLLYGAPIEQIFVGNPMEAPGYRYIGAVFGLPPVDLVASIAKYEGWDFRPMPDGSYLTFPRKIVFQG